jgi:hypothetical protein
MIKPNTRRELGRKRGLASAAAWKPRELDADTLRMRALWDARGLVIREGMTYTAAGCHTWAIRRAVQGRVNQVELVVDGARWRTGSMRAALAAVRWGKWRISHLRFGISETERAIA